MVTPRKSGARSQAGVTTLLITLVLMMSTTILTLAVARTVAVEQRMINNDNWNSRLFLRAESGMARGLAHLARSGTKLRRQRARDGGTLLKARVQGPTEVKVRTEVVLSDVPKSDGYLLLEASSRGDDGSGMEVHVRQLVRPLSVLTPTAESAPPLVIKDCLTSLPISLDIRPENGDSDGAGDAVWLNQDRPCTRWQNVDIHAGQVKKIRMPDDLWSLVFSVSRETFAAMAADQAGRPGRDRDYWMPADTELDAGHWHRSLGDADSPVVLVFPAATACPRFSPGVRVYGLVFIDSDCSEPFADYGVQIFGSLVVNGELNIRNTVLQLNHIQWADHQQTHLRLPILRGVRVPGSWRDF